MGEERHYLRRGWRSRLLGTPEAFLFTLGLPFCCAVIVSTRSDGHEIPLAAWVVGAMLLLAGASAVTWSYRVDSNRIGGGPLGVRLVTRGLDDYVSVREGDIPLLSGGQTLRGAVLVGGKNGETPMRYSTLLGERRMTRWLSVLDQSLKDSRSAQHGE